MLVPVSHVVISLMIGTAVKVKEMDYRDFFENAVVGCYRSTSDGRILAANQTLAAMLGYRDPDDLMSRVTDIGAGLYVNPQERLDWIAAVERDGPMPVFECALRRQDGTTILVSIRARAVFDDQHQLCYLEGIVEDITERKPLASSGNGARADESGQMRTRVARMESALHRIASELALIGMDRSFQVDRLNPSELAGFKSLTKRETEVLRAIVTGDRVRTIAKTLNLAPNTVRNHLKSIFIKLGVRSQVDLVEKLKKRSSE